MNQLILRVTALQAAIDLHLNQPLDWKQHDCARLVTTCLKGLGHPSPLKAIRKYSSEKTALLAMKAARLENLGQAIANLGFEEIAPSMALAGDVVALEAAPEWGGLALGLALGDGRLIAFANGICDHAPITVAAKAWRVPVIDQGAI